MIDLNRVGFFKKVSKEQFQNDMKNLGFPYYSMLTYANIKLPERATAQSAGYDLCSPVYFTLKPGESIRIPTGIRCNMKSDHFLMIVPRSSIGMKNNISLMNTVGIIDADYYNAKNEGHIMAAFKNNNKRSIFSWVNKKRSWVVSAGDRVCQAIFVPYAVTENDTATAERSGGIGSTGVE